MQRGVRNPGGVLWLFVSLLVLAAALPVGAVPALVRTNAGEVLQGGLSGLAPVLRLVDPCPLVGPAAQYDIPLSSILQIFVDFPRVVVETEDRVYIGPYSTFSGIDQELRLDEHGAGTGIFATTLSAIALNGQPFRALPREWTGRGFLVLEKASQPAKTASAAAAAPAPAIAQAGTTTEEELIWGELTPTEPPVEETAGLPWWVGLIAVGLIVGLLLLSSSSGS
ncbi:MAG: hypothetical protein NTY63_01935 [Candidatus Bipolaricaulota bacterium]|nr:hypothetical protein [Candidatus Bipolaricaulota bacterium]